MQTARHYIDGEWLMGPGGEVACGEALNPATSQPAARYANGGTAEAAAAIHAARQAFDQSSWRHTPRLRADILLAFASRLEERKDTIADWLMTLNGKLRREAIGEILAGVSELRYYAGWRARCTDTSSRSSRAATRPWTASRPAWPASSCPGTPRSRCSCGHSHSRWQPDAAWC